MYVLEYLSDPKCEKNPEHALSAEYRLLCSGTLYRDIGGDWSKSEVARILLDEPLVLFAASRPFEDYPLELVVQLTVPQVEERTGVGLGLATHSYLHHPNDEVASDLAALLSLLCRRLITVAGKANERYAEYNHVLFNSAPLPLPLVMSMRRVCWPRHPLTIITSFEGQRLEDHNPRPKAINAAWITGLLLRLPRVEHAKSIVASARLYALALELIHERPDISYQLLISSVETIATAALGSFQPPDDAKVGHQKAVYDLAQSLDLNEDAARGLAIQACNREHWATKKFKKFLVDNVDESVWTEQDELFHHMPQEVLPRREQFERILGRIYDARSKATHVGESFPASAAYTGGPSVSVRASMLFGSESAFPPVVWFERIVNNALCGFWERAVQNSAA